LKSLKRFWIGIDPGLSGAIAIISNHSIEVHDFPVIKLDVKKGTKIKKKSIIDIAAYAELLRPFTAVDAIVTVERVHAMPKQGVTSMFRMGEAFGISCAVPITLGIPLTYASPVTWKKKMLAGYSVKNKKTSLLVAKESFPSLRHRLARVSDDGRAEALLIAEYSRTK